MTHRYNTKNIKQLQKLYFIQGNESPVNSAATQNDIPRLNDKRICIIVHIIVIYFLHFNSYIIEKDKE